MIAPSAELELLRTVARNLLLRDALASETSFTGERVNCPRLLWLGSRHGVLPLLHAALHLQSMETRATWPQGAMAQLDTYRETQQLHALAHARTLCLVQERFDRAKIPLVVADRWLAAQSWHPRPDLCECDDVIPCFVAPGDMARATALLAENLLLVAPGHATRTGHIPVRLGLDPLRSDGAAPLLAGRLRREIAGRTIQHPDAADWLLLLGGKATPHPGLAMGRAVMLAALARKIGNWPAVWAAAAGIEAGGALAHNLAASHRLLRLPPPVALADIEAMACDVPPPPPDREPAPSRREIFDAPYQPTPPLVVRRMLELAQTSPGDMVCDLGCGDGRIAIAAARDFGARGIGIDYDPSRLGEARAGAVAAGVTERVDFIHGDIFSADLSAVTVLCFYLNDTFLAPLQEWLPRAAKPGTRVISHSHAFFAWPPEDAEIIRISPVRVAQIYLWRTEA